MTACAMKRASLVLAAACMLGAVPLGGVAAQEDVVEEFDCETYLATAPVKNTLDFADKGYEYEQEYEAYLTLDTNDVKTWNLGTSMAAGFSCSEPLASPLPALPAFLVVVETLLVVVVSPHTPPTNGSEHADACPGTRNQVVSC